MLSLRGKTIVLSQMFLTTANQAYFNGSMNQYLVYEKSHFILETFINKFSDEDKLHNQLVKFSDFLSSIIMKKNPSGPKFFTSVFPVSNSVIFMIEVKEIKKLVFDLTTYPVNIHSDK